MGPGQQSPFHGFEGFPGFPTPKPDDKPEMGVAWTAKDINGSLFLPAEQVLELLRTNNVLPKMQAHLERHINTTR